MKHLLTAVFILFFIQSSLLLAQNIDLPKNIQSPNASSLGKYGDVPVSYYTGSPNISIPLYDLNVKGIKMPILLMYNASGVRVDDHPGWVGQNWSIDAGGVITRTQRGESDEYSTIGTQYGGVEENLGFMYKGSNLNVSAVSSQSQLISLGTNASNKGYDYEPDIFTFNFLGKSGKFFLGNDGKWKVQSEDNLTIIFENNLVVPLGQYTNFPQSSAKYPTVIGGFKIKDGNGLTYVFGYDQNAIEYSIDLMNQVIQLSVWKSNAWYLTKIIDQYGNEIFNLKYDRGENIAQFYRTIGTTSTKFSGGKWSDPSCSGSSSIDQNAVEGELISPVYLKSINSNYNNLSITFNRSISTELNYDPVDINFKVNQVIAASGWPNAYPTPPNPFYYLGTNTTNATDILNALKWNKLTSIVGQKKIIKLTYNDNSNERLNLLQVDIFGDDGNNPNAKKQSYKLYYNHYESVPKYLSKKIDHWGYNKGVDYVINEQNLSSYYNQRTPDPTYLPIGMLNKIIYPTGGYTSFEYEQHTYNQIVNEAKTSFINEIGSGGGIRIRSITDNDGFKDMVRTFKYVLNYETNKNSTTSSGILTNKPTYYWPNWKVNTSSGGTLNLNIFSVNSIIPLSNSFGPNIGYSKVIEERSDGSYTVYNYSNYGTNSFYDNGTICSLNNNSITSPYDRVSDLSLLRGKLLNVSVYNSSNTLVQQQNLTYRSDITTLLQNNLYYVIGTNTHYQNVCSGSSVSVYKGNSYKLFFLDYDVIQEETVNSFNGNNVSEKTTYTKQDIHLPFCDIRLTLELSKNRSDNKTLLTKFKYPSVYTLQKAAMLDGCNQTYSNCIISSNTAYDQCMQTCGSDPNCTQRCQSAREYIRLQCTSQQSNCIASLPNLANAFVTKMEQNNMLSQVIERQDFLIYPDQSVKVIGGTFVKYSDAWNGHLLPSETLKTNENVPSGVLTESSFNANGEPTYHSSYNTEVFLNEYDNFGNLLQYTPKDGVVKSFIWGYNKTFPVAQIENATLQEIKTALGVTTIPDLGTGGLISSQITSLRIGLPKALVTTYTYDPLIGLTSQTDPNGITSYYQYDSFGRLQYIKDDDGRILKSYEYNYKP